MKYVIGIGRFWYDFIVGDSIVLAIGGAVVLVLGFLLSRATDVEIGQVVLPLAVIGTLVASLRR